MLQREYNGIKWLEFELLADSPLIHACLLRHGGVSDGEYATLNLSRTRDTNSANVKENYFRVMQALGLSAPVVGRLEHGDRIIAVSDPEKTPEVGDGLSTNVLGLPIMMTQADCQAAIFYDPIHHAVANVHSGWRGSVQNIYGKAIAHMKQHYGSKPADLLVCISPSLGPESAEFTNYKAELPEAFWEHQIKPNYFDFWAISERQLVEAGVLPHHIQIARVDTYANSADYFSYRRNKECGRQATLCCLSYRDFHP